jgi:hypothetical protein
MKDSNALLMPIALSPFPDKENHQSKGTKKLQPITQRNALSDIQNQIRTPHLVQKTSHTPRYDNVHSSKASFSLVANNASKNYILKPAELFKTQEECIPVPNSTVVEATDEIEDIDTLNIVANTVDEDFEFAVHHFDNTDLGKLTFMFLLQLS